MMMVERRENKNLRQCLGTCELEHGVQKPPPSEERERDTAVFPPELDLSDLCFRFKWCGIYF